MNFVSPDKGGMGTFKSEPFTTHGGPLTAYLDVTKWGTFVCAGLEDQGWTGTINCYLQVQGSYWDQAAAPLAVFFPDPSIDNKYVDQFAARTGADTGSFSEAGTYILLVEVQNLDGTVTLKGLP